MYYLEVELPVKIAGDSTLSYSGKKYLLQSNNDDLKKEYCLSKDIMKYMPRIRQTVLFYGLHHRNIRKTVSDQLIGFDKIDV